MTKLMLLPILLLLFSCNSDGSDDSANSGPAPQAGYKQEMRNFVIGISQAAKSVHPDFAVIPQNGIELVSRSGEEGGAPDAEYLNAIDGNGQEDLFYGYDNDDKPTPLSATAYLLGFLDISKQAGKTVLVTDYCSSPSKRADSDRKNLSSGYRSYAARERLLNVIPVGAPHGENTDDISQLSEARNFLYLIDPETFSSKSEFLDKIVQTNYDAVIIDLFVGNEMVTASDVEIISRKANGGKRLVLCYMSIGEAEDYRYYWEEAWKKERPGFIAGENRDWKGNFKVRYWDPAWQQIIYGNENSYLTKILNSGFDGVYLDIIDGFEYFEN